MTQLIRARYAYRLTESSAMIHRADALMHTAIVNIAAEQLRPAKRYEQLAFIAVIGCITASLACKRDTLAWVKTNRNLQTNR